VGENLGASDDQRVGGCNWGEYNKQDGTKERAGGGRGGRISHPRKEKDQKARKKNKVRDKKKKRKLGAKGFNVPKKW